MENPCKYLSYELSPYPAALFDDVGMIKTQDSKKYDCFEQNHVVWQTHINLLLSSTNILILYRTILAEVMSFFMVTLINLKISKPWNNWSCEVYFNETMKFLSVMKCIFLYKKNCSAFLGVSVSSYCYKTITWWCRYQSILPQLSFIIHLILRNQK